MTSDRLFKRLWSGSSNISNFWFRGCAFQKRDSRIYIFTLQRCHLWIKLILFKCPILSENFSVIFVGFKVKIFFMVCKAFLEICFTNSSIQFGEIIFFATDCSVIQYFHNILTLGQNSS